MKKLLLSVMTISILLNSTLLAKEATSPYHVKIIEQGSNKKGFGSKIILTIWKKTKNSIKEVFISITTNMAANKASAEIENYLKVNQNMDIKKMNETFHGQIRVALIENFEPTKPTFLVNEPIQFNIQLRQDAFVYLISVSKDESCLLSPNATDSENYFGVQNTTLPATREYTIFSDTPETIDFYLVSSLEVQFFKEFKAKSIYKCTKRNVGLRKIAELNNSNINDVKEVSVTIVK